MRRIVDLVVVALVFGVMGSIVGNMLPSPFPFKGETGINRTIISTENQMSAYEAELFLDSAIAPHQYYIENPQDQNYATGDTEHNIRIIAQYERLKALIKEIK